eukprot:COSAG06_NODE_27371_length_594_cov_1.402020_2_plen_60_part_01
MANGLKLRQMYTQPQCSPTRAALLTGRYPHRTGSQAGVAMPGCETFVGADEIFLPELLRR